MSFSVAEKNRFLVDFTGSSISLHFGKSNLCWVKEFLLSENKLEYSTIFFWTTQKAVVKKAALNPQESLFCFVVEL